jgi:hypothetical protein
MATVYRPTGETTLNVQQSVSVTLDANELHHRWNRWIVASFAKHFDDAKGPYELYLEGDERTTQKELKFAELRMDGPFYRTLSKKQYYIDVEINILCQAHMLPANLYAIHDITGHFTRAFTNCVAIYRLGDGPEDDGSKLGVMRLLKHFRERVEVGHFGILEPDLRMTQSTIEGHYRLHLVLS